jgi:hypothetical protein
MRAIKLPEPPSRTVSMPEIFDRGITSVIRRAIIIGNGSAGAEHQSIGLVRALGLGNKYTLHVSVLRSFQHPYKSAKCHPLRINVQFPHCDFDLPI